MTPVFSYDQRRYKRRKKVEGMMLRKRIWKIHTVAGCEDCGKEFQNYKNGQALAAKHAKDHRHKVRSEIGLAFVYDGRNQEAANEPN